MGIILRHTLRSVKKNAIQIIVIVVAVAIATMVLFASFSMSDVFYNINIVDYTRASQGADMLIGDNSSSNTEFSRARTEELLEKYSDDIEYAEYFLKMSSVLRTDSYSKAVLLEATDLKEYLTRHEIKYVQKEENVTSDYKNAIISRSLAEELGISAGDEVEIYLATYGIYTKLNILYIAENSGIFASETTANILLDLSAVGSKGLVSAVYVEFNDNVTNTTAKIEEIAKEVATVLPNVSVGEGSGESRVKEIVQQDTLLFAVALLFIVAIMMLILLSAYQIIARHRMSEMVTFKAVGASPLQVALIMIAEVALYGIVGSLLGVLLGRMAMQIAVNSLLASAKETITFDAWKYLVSIILGVLVTVIASLVPIISTSKKTIREMISAEEKISYKKENPILLAVSAVAVVGLSVAMSFLSDTMLIICAVILLVVLVLFVKFSAGYVIKGISKLFGKVCKTGPSHLAVVGLGRNKSMRTVALLIAVLVAFSFMVVEVVDIVKTAVEPFRGRYDADIVAYTDDTVNKMTSLGKVAKDVTGLEGVNSCGYFNSHDFLTSDNPENDEAFTIYGVSDYATLTKCSTAELEDDVMFDKWKQTDCPLIINEEMSLRCGWNVGDIVTLISATTDYQDVKIDFEIIGIDYTRSEWDVIGYCKFDILKNKIGVTGTTFLITSESDAEGALLTVRNYFDGSEYSDSFVLPFDEWAYGGKSVLVSGVGLMLTILQIAIYAVGMLGLLNIAVVTFYDRRRELSLYKLSGMSSADRRVFSFVEGLVTGLSGGIIGIAIGLVLNRVIPVFGSLIDRHMTTEVFPASIGIAAAIGCAFFVLIWTGISLVSKVSKMPMRDSDLRR